jgi:hypothetical protein
MNTTTNTATKIRRRFTVAHGTTKIAQYDIHACGCSHVTKATFKVFTDAVASSGEGVRKGLARQRSEQGWTAEMMRVMDCCENAPLA